MATRKTPSTRAAPAPPGSLVQALRLLLRPLVRLLLAHQITFPFLAELLKGVYVDVAARDFALEGKRQTHSRLSLLTGIHRKDVKRLLEAEDREPELPRPAFGAQVVARWTGVRRFLDGRGRPRPLPRSAPTGPSFERLVESVSKDIRARAVLDEWLRLGVVRLDRQDRVCLNADAFVPERGFDEKAAYFGRNLHDHVAAGAHNLLGEGEPLLERSVHYDALSDASVDQLAALAEKTGMRAIQALNRRAIELEERDAKGREPRRRMHFGVYFFRAPADDEPEEGGG